METTVCARMLTRFWQGLQIAAPCRWLCVKMGGRHGLSGNFVARKRCVLRWARLLGSSVRESMCFSWLTCAASVNGNTVFCVLHVGRRAPQSPQVDHQCACLCDVITVHLPWLACAAWVNDAVITRDGSRAVTVSGDALARVWDVKTGSLVCCLEGHSDNIRSVVRPRVLVCMRVGVYLCVCPCASITCYSHPVMLHLYPPCVLQP